MFLFGLPPRPSRVRFWGGLFGMITVPVFTAYTQCPAWSGMMLVLGLRLDLLAEKEFFSFSGNRRGGCGVFLGCVFFFFWACCKKDLPQEN